MFSFDIIWFTWVHVFQRVHIPILPNFLKTLLCILQETSYNKHDCTLIKYLNILHQNRTQKQLQYVFLKILQKCFEIPIFVTLDMCSHFHQK